MRGAHPTQRATPQTVEGELKHAFRTITAGVVMLGLTVLLAGGFLALVVHPRLQTAVFAARQTRIAHEGLVNQETGVRGYLLSRPDAAGAFLQPYFAGRAAADGAFADALRLLRHDAEATRQLRATMAAADAWRSQWAAMAIGDRSAVGADEQAFLARGRSLFDTYRTREAGLVSLLTVDADNELRTERLTLIGMVAFCAAVAATAFAAVRQQRRRLTHYLVEPIVELAGSVRAVRDGAALDETLVTAPRGDAPQELADLWADFEQMTSSLRERHEAHADERATLLTLSEADALTGLLNRRRFDADFAVAWQERERRPLAVVAIDIDHFKALNDTAGHAAGDRVLQRVAHVIDATVRGSDSAYRLGGEEFVVVATGIDRRGVLQLAERIRANVAGATEVTVSCGVATAAGAASPAQLLVAADTALYDAKRAGRDRVCVASADGRDR